MKFRLIEEFKFDTLVESGTSRIYNNITKKSNWAIISAYRSEYSESENRQRLSQLKNEVRNNLKLGFNEFVSRWVEDGIAYDERSLIIYNISYEDAYELSHSFEQSSFIYCDNGRCEEICTNSFESYSPGDVVRKFNISGNHILNIEDAENIFSKRKGGPASMPVKGNRPFTLKSVDEVLNPKASTFNSNYYNTRIY